MNNSKKLLVVVDLQNDFVFGSLGTKEAEQIVPAIVRKIEQYKQEDADIVFTRDTHPRNYLETQEGRILPVKHCIKGTWGWEIVDELIEKAEKIFDKPTFGSTALARYVMSNGYQRIELVGLCTDICVVSNALLLKAHLPEAEIRVDANCCAGVTPESHEAALETMKMCQVLITGDKKA